MDTVASRISVIAAAVLLSCGGGDESGRTDGTLTGVGSLTVATTVGGSGTGETGQGTTDTLGDPTTCSSDDDCPAGQRCAATSGVCLPPDACMLPGDCDGGFECIDGVCTIGGGCGGFQFQLDAVPPNVMILLDRSGSMDGDVPGSSDNRWEVAVSVVETVTSAFDANVRFGLATYSSCIAPGCSPGTIVVPILPANAGNVQNFLATTAGVGSINGQVVGPDGLTRYLCDSGNPETSTGVSLQALVGEPSLQDPERKNAVLLITDGGESGDCTSNVDGPGGAAALFGQAIPVLTFAVGFGDAVSGQLEAIAVAGGTEHGLLANDPTSLQMALEGALQTVASCTFTLDQVPEDPSQIYVFFDLDPAGVPNDAVDGWTYDPVTNSVTFHGSSCEAIKGGTVVDVDIVYGCNMPPAG